MVYKRVRVGSRGGASPYKTLLASRKLWKEKLFYGFNFLLWDDEQTYDQFGLFCVLSVSFISKSVAG